MKQIVKLLLLLLPVLGFAKEKDEIENGFGTIKGQVFTNDNKPAPSVTVHIKSDNKNTTTNEDGKFTISKLPEGSYEIEISLVGYETLTQTAIVEKGKTTQVSIQLKLSQSQLNEVVVTSGSNKFTKVESGYVAKMPLKNLENPQVYTSVTQALMQDQLIVTYSDALKNVPGVVMQLENNSAGGTVTSRGFSTQSFLRNGVPASVGSGTVDPSNIETIEAIKGPSGTLYGSSFVSFGGLFNRVTKKPFDHLKGEVAYTAGGFGLNRLTVDVNTPLNKDKSLLLRVNGASHNEASFQDAGFKSYTFLAPSLSYKIDDKTTLTLEGEYRKEKGNSFYRLFADGTYATGVRSPKDLKIDFNKRFSGDDLTLSGTAGNFYAQLSRKLSKNWTSQTNYTYLSSAGGGSTSYMSMQAGNDSLTRYVTYYEYSNTYATDLQQNFTGDFKIGSMRNRLLFGLDFYSTTTKVSSPGTIAYDKINASNPGTAYTALTNTAVIDRIKTLTFNKYKSLQNTYSAYFQDVLNITEQLIAMASVRVDYFDNKGTKSFTTGTTSSLYHQTAVSPKFGLVYQLVKDQVSLFANYMNGFSNIAPTTQPDGTISSFKPSQANQLEGGVKVNVLQGKLTGSLSYYDIKVKDVTRYDYPLRPTYTVQDGNQSSKGLEAEIVVNPCPGFNVVAGYAYNDSKYEKVNVTLDGFRPTSAGPANTANLWLSYRFLTGNVKGLGLGFGGNYASENKVILSSTSLYALPSYTTLGVSASYDQPKYRINCKVDNVTNQKYWVGWSTTIPQMPSRFSASVALKF